MERALMVVFFAAIGNCCVVIFRRIIADKVLVKNVLLVFELLILCIAK